MREFIKIAATILSSVTCTLIFGAEAIGNTYDTYDALIENVDKSKISFVETNSAKIDPIKIETVNLCQKTAFEEEWIYPISKEEIDFIALVTMAEAESETILGKRLVIDTILNRVDDPHFPDTITDVIYEPNAFSCMWNGRIENCCTESDIVELVKEETLERTNYDCIFFSTEGYSEYGVPMFQECCHYFSSYD